MNNENVNVNRFITTAWNRPPNDMKQGQCHHRTRFKTQNTSSSLSIIGGPLLVPEMLLIITILTFLS
jgi:hypothetical protein